MLVTFERNKDTDFFNTTSDSGLLSSILLALLKKQSYQIFSEVIYVIKNNYTFILSIWISVHRMKPNV